MPTLTAPEKEEVVVEPDLPIEDPSPQPVDNPVDDVVDEPQEPDVAAGLERLAAVGIDNSSLDDGRMEYLRLVGSMASTEPVYVAGNRAPRLKVGHYVLAPGEIVPGAAGWTRREAYERLGRIERR